MVFKCSFIHFNEIYIIRALLSDNNLRMKTGKPGTNRPLSYPRHQMSNRMYRPQRYGQDQVSSSAYTSMSNQGNYKYIHRPNSQLHTTTALSDHPVASSSNQNRMINPQTSSSKFLKISYLLYDIYLFCCR